MDPALQAMLTGGGAGGGGMRLFAVFPDTENTSLEAMLPIGQLTLDELLKKLLRMLQAALVFNFPGGFVFRTFIQKILEILKQQIDGAAYGINAGGDMSAGSSVSPSAGGGKGGGGAEIG